VVPYYRRKDFLSIRGPLWEDPAEGIPGRRRFPDPEGKVTRGKVLSLPLGQVFEQKGPCASGQQEREELMGDCPD